MAKHVQLLVVDCPCCEATIKIDPVTGAVISHKAKEKPAVIEDLTTAVSRLKEEAVRRDEKFQKSMSDQRNRQEILNKRFDELFKQAKEDPDQRPPQKDIDL